MKRVTDDVLVNGERWRLEYNGSWIKLRNLNVQVDGEPVIIDAVECLELRYAFVTTHDNPSIIRFAKLLGIELKEIENKNVYADDATPCSQPLYNTTTYKLQNLGKFLH